MAEIGKIKPELLDEWIRNPVYYQLFLEKNKIQGKITSTQMQFKGAGHLLDRLIDYIKENVVLLDDIDNLEKFIEKFSKLLGIYSKDVLNDLKRNIPQMLEFSEDPESTAQMIVSMTIAKIVQYSRENAYINYGKKKFAEQFLSRTGKEFTKEYEEKLHKLEQRNDREVSILLNLYYLFLLADFFKESNILTNAKRQITKLINRVIEKIND
ncbi:MAG: hypothetical protein ACTSU2_06445 [Promethearchaeota archaeon]